MTNCPMSEGEELYRAILIYPADDAPRLIYADWLEEQGNPERAELIRHMIHFPRDRATYRPPQPASVYWTDAPPGIEYVVRRGFVAEIVLPTRRFLTDAARFFQSQPITRVQFKDREAAVAFSGEFLAVVTDIAPTTPHHWPPVLFPNVVRDSRLSYPSIRQARTALSAAAVDFGRRAAGLPPLR